MCKTHNNCGTCSECKKVLSNNKATVVYMPVPGPPGPATKGERGIPGPPGKEGPKGESAFDLWKRIYNRPDATEEDFFEFLKPEAPKAPDPLIPQFVYKRTVLNVRPEKPDKKTLAGWSLEQPDIDPEYKYVWASFRLHINGGEEEFSEVYLWARYADSGMDGKDGADIEFIFKLIEKESDLPSVAPSNSQVDDYVPEGWSDDTISPTHLMPFTIYCMRTKYNGVWSQFSKPAIWATHAADGVDGKDGKDVEYIFILTSSEDDVPAVPISVNVDDYVPAGHSDDPLSVDENNRICWGFQRTRRYGTWSEYSDPFVYTRFALDGKDGKDIEYIFRRTTTSATPATPIAPSNELDESIPNGWSDDSLGVSETYPYEFRSIRKRLDTGLWGPYTTPRIFSKWGFDGADGVDGTRFEYIFKLTQTPVRPERPTTVSQQNDYVPPGWTDDAGDLSEEFPYQWRCEREKVNNVWNAFKEPKLVMVRGKDGVGTPGTDGFSVAAIYAKSTNPNLAPVITRTDLLPSLWSRTVPVVSVGEYIWKSETYLKADGSFMTGFQWSVPFRLSPVDGAKGDAGNDGTSVTIKNTLSAVSDLPTSGVAGDGYIINGDLYVYQADTATFKNVGKIRGPQGPQGPPGSPGLPGGSPEFQYSLDAIEWRSTYVLGDKYMRIKLSNSNTWGQPIHILGEKGADGASTIIQYAKNNSQTVAPTAGWSNNRPTTGEKEYIWIRIGSKDADGNISWDLPICISGKEGRDAPITIFRGDWDMTKTYIGTKETVHVVLYGDTFYRTTVDAGTIQGVVPNLSPSKWVEIPYYENIATGFLFADSASITNLTVNRLLTSSVGRRVEIDENGIRVTHDNGVPGIIIKTNDEGLAEIVLNNLNGVKILSLGAEGIQFNTLYDETWREEILVPLSPAIGNPTSLSEAHRTNIANYLAMNSCRRIVSGSRGETRYYLANTAMATFNYVNGNYADGRDDSIFNGYHVSKNKSVSNFVSDGWYVRGGILHISGSRRSGGMVVSKFVEGKIVQTVSMNDIPESTLNSTSCALGLVDLVMGVSDRNPSNGGR